MFLFAFLPVVIGLYYLMPPWLKNTFLLLSSLVFYAWGEPIYVALLVASIAGNFAFGLAIDRAHSPFSCRLVVTLAIFGNLAFLAYFKYFSFGLVNFFSNDAAQAGALVVSTAWHCWFSRFHCERGSLDNISLTPLSPTEDSILSKFSPQ